MRNVRVFYKKFGPLRFASHLDMNRYMQRLVRRAGLPIWYTEGFNPHPYMTFALPLSLGFESAYEIMDIRLEDGCTDAEALAALQKESCAGLEFFKVAAPVMKPGAIAYAQYEILLDTDDATGLAAFLAQESIPVQKKNKKGKLCDVDIAPRIKSCTLEPAGQQTRMLLTCNAGNDNLNPVLLLEAAFTRVGQISYTVNRRALYTADGNIFE